MKQKKFMFKAISLSLFATTALILSACGSNPIEVENQKSFDFDKKEISAALDNISDERANVDFYKCTQSNQSLAKDVRETRCKNFIAKYQASTEMSSIIKMVSDTKNYNDKGLFIGSKYIVTNKILNLTLTEYSNKEKLNPEIRFNVKTFIDGEASGYEQMTSAFAMDKAKIKEWNGTLAVTVQIPRGIDALEICPIVRSKTESEYEFTYEDLIKGNCITVNDIGYIEDKVRSLEQKSSTGDVSIKWEWFLYSI